VTKHRDLAYNDRLPEAVLDAVMEYISTLLVNFRVTLQNPTTLQVAAGVGNDQVGAGVQGRWRWNSATVTAAHPAGAAGTYDVWITASDNNFVPSGNPPGLSPENDLTNYAFALAITAQGVGGSQVPPVGPALNRRIGTTTWDGAKILRFNPLAGNLPISLADLAVLAPESATRNLIQSVGDWPELILKRLAAQTANLVTLQDDTGATIGYLSENGRVYGAGGLVIADYSTAARDALTAARKPTRVVIWNTDSNLAEVNVGTGAAPVWQPFGGGGPLRVSTKTGPYTLVLGDAGTLIEYNSASPGTFTIPLNVLPNGAQVSFSQIGAGQLTIAIAGGGTLRADPGAKLHAAGAIASAYQRGVVGAAISNDWVLGGNLVP
jgi:hypothetical protein